MIVGIILAAGKGTRIKSKNSNKVTIPFLNKPLIIYAVDLFSDICDMTVVVVGAFAQSVKEVLKNHQVTYAYQHKRFGTAHAVKVGLSALENKNLYPEIALVSYGDHTMFYKKETVKKFIELHKKEKAAVSIITTLYNEPNKLAFGRVIRNKDGFVVDNIEQKDATVEQKKIKELNAGFYCFDFNFLKKNISKVKKSPITGEYYINSLIKIAVNQKQKVVGFKVPFSGVGIGINRHEELEESQKIYQKIQNNEI